MRLFFLAATFLTVYGGAALLDGPQAAPGNDHAGSGGSGTMGGANGSQGTGSSSATATGPLFSTRTAQAMQLGALAGGVAGTGFGCAACGAAVGAGVGAESEQMQQNEPGMAQALSNSGGGPTQPGSAGTDGTGN